MKQRLLRTFGAALWLLVFLATETALAEPRAGTADERETSPTDSHSSLSGGTRELLRLHGLKRLARREPAAAVRALDVLRSDGAISARAAAVAIAEVALSKGREAPPDLGLFLDAAAQTYPAALAQAAAAHGAVSGGAAEGGVPPAALGLHRRAVERLIDGLQDPAAPALDVTQEIAGPLGRYRLTWVDASGDWRPATHRFVAASGIPRKQRQVIERPGIGAPVVAVARGEIPGEAEFEQGSFPIYRYFYPLTAVLELGPGGAAERTAVLRIVDPRLHDRHRVGEADVPLAFDVGAQLAAMVREIDLVFAKKGLRHAGKYVSRAGLYLLEPRRSGKIPAVLIHGLSSSPETWAEPFEGIQLDPELRHGYQFWFFVYPTGLPFPYSAMILRRALVQAVADLEAAGADSRHRRMVLIGHSMGGLLTRMQVTPTGDALWQTVFGERSEPVELAPADAELMREILVVEPLAFVERAVFCSTPHRGSKLAANALGKLGASVVKVPGELAALGKRVLVGAARAVAPGQDERDKMPDSVQSLQPEAPILVALDELPIDPGITYHSIVGDRGKGDTPDSTDGLVPYWSSHLEGAASELIVPSGHGTHKHPQGVEELRRILHEHLGANPRP